MTRMFTKQINQPSFGGIKKFIIQDIYIKKKLQRKKRQISLTSG